MTLAPFFFPNQRPLFHPNHHHIAPGLADCNVRSSVGEGRYSARERQRVYWIAMPRQPGGRFKQAVTLGSPAALASTTAAGWTKSETVSDVLKADGFAQL